MKPDPKRDVTLLDGTVHLEPGQEWHSPPINTARGDWVAASATSSKGRFCVKIYAEEDYISSYSPGRPKWFLLRFHAYRATKWVWYTRPHRLVFRVPHSQPATDIHIIFSVRRGSRSEPPVLPKFTVSEGATTAPIRAREAVESAIVWTVIGVGILALALVDAAVGLEEGKSLFQHGAPLVALFQADAEWCLFLAAVYVATKTLPEWLAKSSQPR